MLGHRQIGNERSKWNTAAPEDKDAIHNAMAAPYADWIALYADDIRQERVPSALDGKGSCLHWD